MCMKKIMGIICLEMIIFIALIYYIQNRSYPLIEAQDLNIRVVHITGAINQPGTYKVKDTMTLNELIAYAGPLLPSADLSHIQLFETIEKQAYHIPFYKSVEEQKKNTYKVNLNEANITLLKTIPGMTDVRLEHFLAYRVQVKIIYDIKELLNVKYIGQKTFDEMSDYVTV